MNLAHPIAKTAIKFKNVIYAAFNTNHGEIRRLYSIDADECGFLNANGDWLDRKEAFVVAMYHDQLVREAYLFLAQRFTLGYDLTDTHPGLDSMWLKNVGDTK